MTVMGPGGSGNQKDPQPPQVPDVDPLRQGFGSGFSFFFPDFGSLLIFISPSNPLWALIFHDFR
jgi:hypothetical protein